MDFVYYMDSIAFLQVTKKTICYMKSHNLKTHIVFIHLKKAYDIMLLAI